MSTARDLGNLTKILLGGFAVFLALAMTQEWRLFATAWFGAETASSPEMPEDERRAAADAVVELLSLVGHLYASGGDPRFADRLPASETVRDEMLEDIVYLRHNHRFQETELQHLEVTAVEALGGERVEVRTRELWTVRLRWSARGAEAEPPRAQLTRGRYFLARDGRGWRVEGWDVLGPEEEAPEAP